MSGRTHTKRFRIRRASVPDARHHVESLLTEWKLGCLAESAALIASELATNAVNHAKGTGEFFELAVRRRNGVLILEVSDSYQWQMPEMQKPDADDSTGRGLLIVDMLSDKWGVRPRDPGKTVWAQLLVQSKGATC